MKLSSKQAAYRRYHYAVSWCNLKHLVFFNLIHPNYGTRVPLKSCSGHPLWNF